MSNKILAAIILAVLAKPMKWYGTMHLLINTLFSKVSRKVVHIIIIYLFPITAIVYAFLKLPLDKVFVLYITVNVSTILLSLLLDIQGLTRRRVENIEDRLEVIEKHAYIVPSPGTKRNNNL